MRSAHLRLALAAGGTLFVLHHMDGGSAIAQFFGA